MLGGVCLDLDEEARGLRSGKNLCAPPRSVHARVGHHPDSIVLVGGHVPKMRHRGGHRIRVAALEAHVEKRHQAGLRVLPAAQQSEELRMCRHVLLDASPTIVQEVGHVLVGGARVLRLVLLEKAAAAASNECSEESLFSDSFPLSDAW